MYNHHGLKGAPRIVYEDMARLILNGRPVTTTELASETGYSAVTVSRAVNELIQCGLVHQMHQNGGRAEYALCSGTIWKMEELMISLVQALAKATQMSAEERSRRLAMAFAADRIFSKGKELKKLIRQSPDGFGEEALEYIQEHEVTKLTKVWPLERATEIEEQLDEYLRIARNQ
jgi:DNA-binding transcriptional regulator GbsR (MarR family)